MCECVVVVVVCECDRMCQCVSVIECVSVVCGVELCWVGFGGVGVKDSKRMRDKERDGKRV